MKRRCAVRDYTIRICDDCYYLVGEMCHNPECVFCRRTMEEVGELLDDILIRPIVNGERLRNLVHSPKVTTNSCHYASGRYAHYEQLPSFAVSLRGATKTSEPE